MYSSGSNARKVVHSLLRVTSSRNVRSEPFVTIEIFNLALPCVFIDAFADARSDTSLMEKSLYEICYYDTCYGPRKVIYLLR